LELIKTQHPTFPPHLASDLEKRVAREGGLRANTVEPGVNSQHEFVEMDAPGGDGGRERSGEKVCDARFPCANIAVYVDSFEGFMSMGLGRYREVGLEIREAHDQCCLTRILDEALAT